MYGSYFTLYVIESLKQFVEKGGYNVRSLLAKEVNLFCRKRLTFFGDRGEPLLVKEVNLFRQKRLT